MISLTRALFSLRAIVICAVSIILIVFISVQQHGPNKDGFQHQTVVPAHTYVAQIEASFNDPPVKNGRQHVPSQPGHHRHHRQESVRGVSSTHKDISRINGSAIPHVLCHSIDNPYPSERNVTAEHPLFIKRVGPDRLTFNEYMCKGRRYLANMRAARPDPPKWAYSNLPPNGWKIEKGGAWPIGAQVKEAMKRLKIPVEDKENLQISAILVNSFVNFRQDVQQPKDGDYANLYNVAGHAIIAVYNYSPSFFAKKTLGPNGHPLQGDALRALIPNMNSWADIVWATWAEAAGDQAGDLRYIFRDNVSNGATQYVIELIEGSLQDGEVSSSLKLPWPGHTYSLTDDRGLALLGSQHGVGISWLYVNGRKALGMRDQIKVTVFTGQPDPPSQYDDYYLLWDLGPPPPRV